MPEENNGQAPAGNANSQTLPQNPGMHFPQEGVMGEPGTSETSNKERDPNNLSRDVHWIHHGTFYTNLILALIGFGTLWIFYHQLQQMIYATKAARDAADDACISAQIARQTLVDYEAGEADSHNAVSGVLAQASAASESDAAVISESGVMMNKSVPITSGQIQRGNADQSTPDFGLPGIRIDNVGKTAARSFDMWYTVQLLPRNVEPKLDAALPDHAKGQFPPGTEQIYGADVVDESGKFVTDFDSEVPKVRDGSKYLAFFGRVAYNDAFDVHHWTKFCSYIDYSPFPPREPGHPLAVRHEKCADYNDQDRNFLFPAGAQNPRSTLSASVPEIHCETPKH